VIEANIEEKVVVDSIFLSQETIELFQTYGRKMTTIFVEAESRQINSHKNKKSGNLSIID
jgi:hypothetical protein